MDSYLNYDRKPERVSITRRMVASWGGREVFFFCYVSMCFKSTLFLNPSQGKWVFSSCQVCPPPWHSLPSKPAAQSTKLVTHCSEPLPEEPVKQLTLLFMSKLTAFCVRNLNYNHSRCLLYSFSFSAINSYHYEREVTC